MTPPLVEPADEAVEEPTRGPDYVQSLERGLSVIRAFDAAHPEQTLSEVARVTGLTRAAARRFLLTLQELGYVRTDGRHFMLRPRVLELGYAYLSSLGLPNVALPHMKALGSEVRESCSLSIMDGDETVCVALVPTPRIMMIAINVGVRFPAYPTAMGRVLLAGMSPEEFDGYMARTRFQAHTPSTVTDPATLAAKVDEVRRLGFSIVDEELEQGLRALSVPVRGVNGQVIAALNLAVPAGAVSMEAMTDSLLPPLLKAAAEIEADLQEGRRPAHL